MESFYNQIRNGSILPLTTPFFCCPPDGIQTRDGTFVETNFTKETNTLSRCCHLVALLLRKKVWHHDRPAKEFPILNQQ